MGFSEPLRFRRGFALSLSSPLPPWTMHRRPYHADIFPPTCFDLTAKGL